MRLFKAILLLMLVASVVPTVMVGYFAVAHTRDVLIHDAQEASGAHVQQLRLRAEALLGEPTRAILSLAKEPGFFALPRADQRNRLTHVLAQRHELMAITLFAFDGAKLEGAQAVSEIPLPEVAAHEARAKALFPRLDGLQYSEPALSAASQAPTLTFAMPVGNPLKGYIAAEVSLAGLMQTLRKAGAQSSAYVVDSRGHVVAASMSDAHVGTDFSSRPVVKELLTTLDKSPDPDLFRVGKFGEGKAAVVAAYTAIPEADWAVVFEEPVARAYAQVGLMQKNVGMGLLFALLVAFGLAATFSRQVTRPLKGLMASALEIAQGKFGTSFKVETSNELGQLGSTFNYMSQQLMAYDHETRGLYDNLEKGYLETIVALANSIDSKDAYTRGHSQRVGDTAVEIGRELGLSQTDIRLLRYGGILHDIGKIGIVESILLKQSQLTTDEMTVMREHPSIGDSIIGPVTILKHVRAAVRHHHERWDGSGYPDKLQGEAIPLMARIVACADTFDACTSTRPYQKAMPLEVAMGIMDKLSGQALDPKVVQALRRVLHKKGVAVEGQTAPAKLAS